MGRSSYSDKCITKWCRNKRAPDRPICYKCRARKRKDADPEAYFYYKLMSNAKRRGKEFEISLSEFRKFCQETNYIDTKGKSATSMTIDRIDNSKGYSIGNIRVIQNWENASKGVGPAGEEEDLPF